MPPASGSSLPTLVCKIRLPPDVKPSFLLLAFHDVASAVPCHVSAAEVLFRAKVVRACTCI